MLRNLKLSIETKICYSAPGMIIIINKLYTTHTKNNSSLTKVACVVFYFSLLAFFLLRGLFIPVSIRVGFNGPVSDIELTTAFVHAPCRTHRTPISCLPIFLSRKNEPRKNREGEKKKKCKINSIETSAAVIYVTFIATRIFLSWSSRHGLHFYVRFFIFSSSLFFLCYCTLVDGESEHLNSGDQSGRLCCCTTSL